LLDGRDENVKFEWDVYKIEAIESRINFVRFFNKEIPIEYLIGLDTYNLFDIFPLDYIIKIFHFPERSIG
jgi:hypothetical protein